MKDNVIVQAFYGKAPVRTVRLKDGHGFVAADIAAILEHSDTSMMVRGLDDDEHLIQTFLVSGQKRDMIVLTESGLYTVLIRSNKPQARKFRRWVTHDVLPQIRKKGTYTMKGRSLTGIKLELSNGKIVEYKGKKGPTPAPIPKEFEDMMEGGCSAAYAAEVLKINPVTAYQWLKRLKKE